MEELIERFITITGASRELASQYLARNDNDLMTSIEDYYGNLNTSKPQKKKGVNTFRDLNEEEEDDKTNTNFFTGGEKSGLQVEDPNDRKKKPRNLVEDIFERARQQMDQPDDRPSSEPVDTPKFTGTGFKLGDTESASERIPDAHAGFRKLERATREITFWRQGFTVADGPLLRYDDPQNESLLGELNQGRVPLSLLDVEFGQDVDVNVIRKVDEDYTPPKRKVGGYGGSGHRLGSPVPGEPSPAPEVEKPKSSLSTDSNKPQDTGAGDTTVQIRFANGKKTTHKFNSTDSITVVYDFVKNHEFSEPRDFVLSHSFPVKPIAKEGTVADAKLKNAVIVQRWT
ncbi:UBX domain-containing protein 1 [[Candida] jaroonii]|uniref:UBX domain-containing protein 1 n=1 Tax=[Candida] jaroonii TaxID=467808 RepID=A0ACA9Y3M0_9ASCO|nr:UBX domain-containing protein 1 [[Candida] jaroonii]